jgi:hypothetical protein
MKKERLFLTEALVLIIIITLSVCGCGKPSNEKLAEIIKTSPQNGMVLVTPQFRVEKFDSVDIISVYDSDTDLKSVIPPNAVLMADPTEMQKYSRALSKKSLFVRSYVTGKVVPTVVLPAPLMMPPAPQELSLQEKTAIWMILRPDKDGKWRCDMLLGVETAATQ